MSILSEIERLKADKEAIKRALIEKGVTDVTNHGFDDFSGDIMKINATEIPSNYGRITRTVTATNAILTVE